MAYAKIEDRRAASKKHYRENKAAYLERNKLAKERLSKVIRDAKDKPCMDCGVQFPYVCMDFDHVRGKKNFDIGGSYITQGVRVILAEIAKCEVVCANCHRIRTANKVQFGDSVISNTSDSDSEDSRCES